MFFAAPLGHGNQIVCLAIAFVMGTFRASDAAEARPGGDTNHGRACCSPSSYTRKMSCRYLCPVAANDRQGSPFAIALVRSSH